MRKCNDQAGVLYKSSSDCYKLIYILDLVGIPSFPHQNFGASLLLFLNRAVLGGCVGWLLLVNRFYFAVLIACTINFPTLRENRICKAWYI